MKKMLYELCGGVTIDGREYKLNTDFRVWIEIEHLLSSRSMGDGETLAKILTLAYPVLPDSLEGAINGVLWFYSAGEVKREEREAGRASYDLKLDFDYIWGSFLSEFGIDLCETRMHWWKFRALLLCLSESSRFSQIVGYRSVDLSKLKNVEEKRFYEKMKKRFMLPDIRTEEEKMEDTAKKLAELF